MESRFQRISEHFEHARQLSDAAARCAYLDAECEVDLRSEVDALLAAHDEDDEKDPRRDSAILPGLGDAVSAAWTATQSEPPAPELVEGFQILERIGTGGMGTVYAARQIEPRRTIALKVLRPEADRERFRREVLALARLQHPGIAQILLSGECTTPMGTSPFLAMELVDGIPVDRYAQSLDRRARVELVIRICDAVAHAHRRGIIHRDLKPSNILVTKDGQPKVLDFGLAMATDDSGDGFERQTKTGHLVGTLAYMSPEQATGARDAVDTRSDVYALGVLAYEILTGKLPHALDGLPLQTALRTLADEDPESVPELRGDLWIILRKALAKDPEQRYDGAASLAADLRRYLDDEPIEARPPSAMYQIRKFVRRHKAPVAGLATTLLALVVGLLVALRAAHREANEHARAERERDVARAAAAHAYLKAAVGDMATHNYVSAARNLEQIAPVFRDWEWSYLHTRLDRSVEFRPLPDGVTVHDVIGARTAFGEEIRGHPYRLQQDLEAKTVRIVDGSSGRSIECTGIDRKITMVAPGPRGLRFVLLADGAGHASHRIYVCSADGGAPHHVLPGSTNAGGCIALDPEGNRLAFSGYEGAVYLYDVEAGKRTHSRFTHSRDFVPAVAFGAGDRIATGGFDRTIEIADARTNEVIRVLHGHSAPITGLAFSRDARTLLSGAQDGSVRVWDVDSGRLQRVIAVPNQYVSRVAFGKDERDIWALCGDGLRRWRMDEDRLTTFRFPGEFIYGVAFHPNGRYLAISMFKGGTAIADCDRGGLARRSSRYATWGIAFAPNGDMYSTGTRFRSPKWDLDDGEHIFATARSVVASADGSRVAGGGGEGTVRLYRPADGSIEAEWTGLPTRIEALDISPNGQRLAIGGTGGFLQVRSVPDGAILFEKKLAGEINAVAFHPQKPLLATGGLDRVIRIWDLRTGLLHRRLEGHIGRIWALNYHPSGTRLASGAHDATVRIWDPETGLEKLRVEGHQNYIYSLDFSPDGTMLATGSGDFTVRLWSTRPMRERWAKAEAGK